ncbi:MAG: hypothetical protein ACLQPV_09525 [Vulcanimicrobiaceae bacterium]
MRVTRPARLVALAAAMLVLASQASPANASDASALQDKIRAALRSAKSFVMTATVKAGTPGAPAGGSVVYTVVAPNRYRQVSSPTLGADDTILIGNQIYGHKGAGWDVQTWTNALVAGFESDVFLVDVTSVDGTNFVMRYPHEGPNKQTLLCTYDPQTFRPQTCTGEELTLTYAQYDDPSIAIPTPPNAKREDQ